MVQDIDIITKFTKMDQNNNTIVTIKYNKFKDYLDGVEEIESNLIELFKKFNYGFTFGQWITAINAIEEMHNKKWPQWRQTEWAGWFLEYKFANYIEENNLENQMKYIGNLQKKDGDLDFDVWFDEEYFYGDLKASDINKIDTPGNDQENFLECINKYGKFWYIIYEHETIKDSESNSNYEATRFRNNFIKSIDNIPDNKFDELSYHTRMKHSVKFIKMTIIELNRINYREVLSDFNQARQPDGSKRKPKFKISKRNMDNFVIFRHQYTA